MKKFAFTALTTAICAFSIVAAPSTPSLAQQPAVAPSAAPSATPAPATNPQSQLIEQLKITKDQQVKLAKLEQNFIQKKTAILTSTQKEQVLLAMQQGKPPALTLTAAQKNQLKAIYVSALAEQDAILTPEQKLKIKELNKQSTTPKR